MSHAYTIDGLINCGNDWDSPPWSMIAPAQIDQFHARSSNHRPAVQVKAAHATDAITVFFRVDDQFVRARYTDFQDPVYTDSCVEFFVRPNPAAGYFNFEINAIGTLLLTYIEDPTRTPEGFARMTPVSADIAALVDIHASLTGPVEPEREGAQSWTVRATIPFAVFDAYLPSPASIAAPWTGNFYKCADATSHPHWASWAPIGEELNFHCPEYFGQLVFEG